jgi:hypothetical protein
MNTDGTFFYPDEHLRIDNTQLSPGQAAARIVDRFRFPRRTDQDDSAETSRS